MGIDQLKELKRLQRENEQLRRAVSDLTLDKLILKEAAKGAVQLFGHVHDQWQGSTRDDFLQPLIIKICVRL